MTERSIRAEKYEMTRWQSGQLRAKLPRGTYWLQIETGGLIQWNWTLLQSYLFNGADSPEHQALGIDSGYKSSSDNDDGSGGKLSLIADLQAIATGGRTIYIAFDRDSNPQTVKRVQKARQKLAQLFGKFGCEVRKYLEETVATFSPSYVRNVIEFAIGEILHEGWTEASNLLYIPFTNGVLEMATKQLLPHSPDYGFTWQLPRSYSAIEAQWDAIDKFLHSLCVGNQQLRDIALSFCAAILTGRSDLQKFLYLFGSGANGKGAFMSLLSMLVGKENTHSTTMADLNGNQFEPANLKGKRLVVMTDEDKRVGGLSVFKSATGQDPIRYERKGKDASNFIFKGVFVIAANSPTFVGDSNYAIKRRKLDFPCLARIAESDRRDLTPEFEADLTAFTTYLLSLPDEWVTATIRGAGNVEAVRQLNWEMAKREDSIAAFFSDKLVIDPEGSIGCGALYKSYQGYCEESGLKSKSINNFTPSLLELCNDSLGHSIAHKHTKAGKVIKG